MKDFGKNIVECIEYYKGYPIFYDSMCDDYMVGLLIYDDTSYLCCDPKYYEGAMTGSFENIEDCKKYIDFFIINHKIKCASSKISD